MIVRGGLVLTAAYAACALLIPTKLLIDLLNSTFLGVSLALAIVYAPLAWQAMAEREFGRVSQLTIGIGCIWTALILARVLSVIAHIYERPNLFWDSVLVGAVAYIAVIGGVLHITAIGFHDDSRRLEPRVKRLLFVAVILAILTTLSLTAFAAYKAHGH